VAWPSRAALLFVFKNRNLFAHKVGRYIVSHAPESKPALLAPVFAQPSIAPDICIKARTVYFLSLLRFILILNLKTNNKRIIGMTQLLAGKYWISDSNKNFSSLISIAIPPSLLICQVCFCCSLRSALQKGFSGHKKNKSLAANFGNVLGITDIGQINWVDPNSLASYLICSAINGKRQ
jgi:hypothetical protein